MANAAIGIDFGHAHIKLVEMRRRGRHAYIKRAALIPLPKGTLEDGRPVEAALLSEALSEMHVGLRLDRVAVVVGVTGSEVIIRPMTLTEVPEAELDKAVRQEMAVLLRMTPEELEQYFFDYHLLLSPTINQHDVVVVGMERSVIDAYVSLLREAKLAPHVIDVEAFSLPRVLYFDGRGCYIEIGAEHTQVFVTNDGDYTLYRLIPTGMAELTEAVASAYGIAVSEAFRLLQRTHIDSVITDAPGDRTAMRRILQEISGGVIQTLEFVRARQRTSSISDLFQSAFLCGGGALQQGMTQLLSDEIGIPVEVARPLTPTPGGEALPADILSVEPLFAGALGLALRGIDEL